MMKYIIFVVIFVVLIQSGCVHFHRTTNTEADEMVILIHGFGRSNLAMWKMTSRLEASGYKVHQVGYHSLTQNIDEITGEISGKINALNTSVYQKVHLVGHSFGGLLIRSYLDKNKIKNLGNVVTLGSPNKGTPVVDYYEKRWWFSLAGPAVQTMSTKNSEFLSSLKKPYYPLGVIAGNIENPDREYVLPGKDDGLVPLESTKVDGMTDFIVVNARHSMLRYNLKAFKQILHFLKHARFDQLSKGVP